MYPDHLITPLKTTFVLIFTFLISSCASITPKCEPLDVSEISIPEVARPGKTVRLTADGYVMVLKVTGYSEKRIMKAIEVIHAKNVEVDISTIEEICILEGGLSSSGASISDNLSHAPMLIMLPAIPLVPYFSAEEKKRKEEREKIRHILDQDEKKYEGKSPTEIEARLGNPSKKFLCLESDRPWLKQRSPWHIEVWEYQEKQIPKGKKYLYFDSKYKKLYSIDNWIPESCRVHTGKTRDLTSTDVANYEAWEKADAKESLVRAESNFLLFASNAYLRGDMEASYRLLEDLFESEYPHVREKANQYLNEHPEILTAAKKTFSLESFKESKKLYGNLAQEIEAQRLKIYKKVAPLIDYQEALIDYKSVFGN